MRKDAIGWHNSLLAPHIIMYSWQTTLVGHPNYRRWLTDHGSLTLALKQCCPELRVIRLRQGPGKPNADEFGVLRLNGPRRCMIRDVVLTCAGRPVVFAHSVIPLAGLAGPWRDLTRLGNRPLGEALFNDPLVRRHALEFRRLNARHPLYRSAIVHTAVKPPALWARRSVFERQGQPILVTEVFLPALLELPPRPGKPIPSLAARRRVRAAHVRRSQ